MSKRNSAKPIILEQHPESEFAKCQTVDLSDGISATVGPLKSDESAIHVQSLVFASLRFDADAAEEWMSSNDWTTAARSAYKHTSLKAEGPKFFDCTRDEFVRAESEGMPIPEEKDDAESWQRVSTLIVNALSERGWYVWGEGSYDFEPLRFYDDNVICVDVESGENYMIPYMIENGVAVLGNPVKADVTYTPGTAPNSGTSPQVPANEPVSAMADPPPADKPTPKGVTERERFRAFPSVPSLVRAEEATPSGVKKRPIFKLLVCHSGWSRDRRYFERDGLIEAVERGVFDGVNFYIKHPDKETGDRDSMACALSLTGRTTWQDNRAGGVDVFCDVMFANTDDGEEMTELMRMSIEQEVPMCGTSVYGRTQSLKNELRDGRVAERVYMKIHQLYAIDFVDRAALARTGPVELLAARADEQPHSKRGATPTMTITPEMAALQAKVDAAEKTAAEANTRAEKAERSIAVETLMASCPLPIAIQAPLRAQLNLIIDADQRKAQYDLVCAGYATGLPVVKAGNKGAGGGAGDDKPGLDVQGQVADEIIAVANSRGLKVEDLVAAQERRKGKGDTVRAANTTKDDGE